MAAAADDTTQLFEGIMTDYEKKLEQQQKLLDLVRPSVRINGGAVICFFPEVLCCVDQFCRQEL